MTLSARPGYLDAAPPSSAAVGGPSYALAAPAVDQFAPDPSTLGNIPSASPECAPEGRYPLEAINPGERITVAGSMVEIARLVVPSESTYTDLAVQWWVDFPFLYDVGGIDAVLQIGGGPPIAIPLPTFGPLRFPKCIKPGLTVVLSVIVDATIALGDTAFGNTLYVGGSLQVGYENPQWFNRTADRSRSQNSCRSIITVIAPGAPMANLVATPVFVATRVRITWPQLGAAAAAGRIFLSTNNQLGATQGIVAIDQSLGNLQPTNSYVFPMADLRELQIGAPAPAGLLAPASVVVEWDVWRIR